MTTPPPPTGAEPPRRDDPEPDRSWNPFRRLKEAFGHDDDRADKPEKPRQPDAARLGPAEPTGFDWLETPAAGPGQTPPASPGPSPAPAPAPAPAPTAEPAPAPEPLTTSPKGAMAPNAQVTNGQPVDNPVDQPSQLPTGGPLTTSPKGAMAPKVQVTNGQPVDNAVQQPAPVAPDVPVAAEVPAAPGVPVPPEVPSAPDVPVAPDMPVAPGAAASVNSPMLGASRASGGIAGRDADGLLVLGGTPGAAAGAPSAPGAGAGPAPQPGSGLCAECGGTVDPDGYCENCGAKAPDPRHHYRITATPWLAGVCDRGVKHPGNEDALAIRGGDTPDGQRAAIVVCDGVSSAPHSAQASEAAVEAAVEVLTSAGGHGVAGVPAALIGALGKRLELAADAAAQAVLDVSARMSTGADGAPGGGPSSTFVAAIVEDGAGVVGCVGDSRAYWFGDDGSALRLTEDDSWAAEQIRAGSSRAEAEAGPHAHTITRWLGEDCPDHAPRLTTLDLSRPGWLLLCSDGLWNYASEPEALAAVFRERAAAVPPDRGARQPAAELALALVDWAKAQGGHDNITVGLAYLLPRSAPATPGAPAAPEAHQAPGVPDSPGAPGAPAAAEVPTPEGAGAAPAPDVPPPAPDVPSTAPDVPSTAPDQPR